MAREKIFIIDISGFVFRAYHMQPELLTSGGMQVGALFGIASMLIKFITQFKPRYLISVFDSGGKNFRHQIYREYKSHRPPLPENLITQLPLTRDIIAAFQIASLSMSGFEADDIIASVAHKFCNTHDIIIVSSDKDLMQLIDKDICMFDPLKAKYVQIEDVIAKFGIAPTQVCDFLAMTGDISDNIPGIVGIGPKTASELLNEFGTLDNIFAQIDNIASMRRRAMLVGGKDSAILSRQLVNLDKNIAINIELASLFYTPPNNEAIKDFVTKYEFTSLEPRMQRLGYLYHEQIHKTISTPISTLGPSEILLLAEKAGIISIISEQGQVYLVIESILYSIQDPSQLFTIVQQKHICVITYNLKNLLHQYADNYLYKPDDYLSVDDIMLMYYVATGEPAEASMIAIVNIVLGIMCQDFLEAVTYLERCYNALRQKLIATHNYSVYKEIDLPLSIVLFQMEKCGIQVDSQKLEAISHEITHTLETIEDKIFKFCKQRFNIGSPKQLGDILFNKLGLPSGKKSSKTKNHATGIDVLTKLSDAGFVVADYLIEWRELSKIQNTYADALQKQITHDGRIHTKFSQVSTLTGRLSSINPNLQNIPIRSQLGNSIRGAFIAKSGYKLVSFDYSQIELRVLSNIANVASLQDAFRNDIDIHTQTACKIFNLEAGSITPELRRKAKEVNFSIIYGISAFGLAGRLGVEIYEAQQYINQYFAQYPEISRYITSIKAFVKKHGYVQNLFGRRCVINKILESNANIRHIAERSAINAPIQSTAADIAKLATIQVHNFIIANALKSSILLQIHDEILLEMPDNEIAANIPKIQQVMRSVVNSDLQMKVNSRIGGSWQ